MTVTIAVCGKMKCLFLLSGKNKQIYSRMYSSFKVVITFFYIYLSASNIFEILF